MSRTRQYHWTSTTPTQHAKVNALEHILWTHVPVSFTSLSSHFMRLHETMLAEIIGVEDAAWDSLNRVITAVFFPESTSACAAKQKEHSFKVLRERSLKQSINFNDELGHRKLVPSVSNGFLDVARLHSPQLREGFRGFFQPRRWKRRESGTRETLAKNPNEAGSPSCVCVPLARAPR